VWERGGVITTTITMAAAMAIVRRSDRNLLSENGGSISITPNWAKFLLAQQFFAIDSGLDVLVGMVASHHRLNRKTHSTISHI